LQKQLVGRMLQKTPVLLLLMQIIPKDIRSHSRQMRRPEQELIVQQILRLP
jgi:hypothetical protein